MPTERLPVHHHRGGGRHAATAGRLTRTSLQPSQERLNRHRTILLPSGWLRSMAARLNRLAAVVGYQRGTQPASRGTRRHDAAVSKSRRNSGINRDVSRIHRGSEFQQDAPIVTPSSVQILDSVELAHRLNLPASWVRNQVRSRASDPIPHIRFGRYVRFEWNSPQLVKWLERHRIAA